MIVEFYPLALNALNKRMSCLHETRLCEVNTYVTQYNRYVSLPHVNVSLVNTA